MRFTVPWSVSWGAQPSSWPWPCPKVHGRPRDLVQLDGRSELFPLRTSSHARNLDDELQDLPIPGARPSEVLNALWDECHAAVLAEHPTLHASGVESTGEESAPAG